jgi:hypothetical protein
MDEVEWAVQGHVDNLRYQRRAALMTGMFKKGTSETDLYGLPYDDEMDGKMTGDEITQLYDQYKHLL